MIYLDANVFIYAASDEGPKGKAAAAMLREALARGAVTASFTVDEFLWAVRKKLGRDIAADKVRQLLGLDLEVDSVTRDDAEDAIELFEGALDPRDAIRAAVALRRGCRKIVTSDAAFERVEGLTRVAY
jgi:predicted nucleic acid-binding protein